MNQFLKNHQLNKAEIGVTDESISQDTFSSNTYFDLKHVLIVFVPLTNIQCNVHFSVAKNIQIPRSHICCFNAPKGRVSEGYN